MLLLDNPFIYWNNHFSVDFMEEGMWVSYENYDYSYMLLYTDFPTLDELLLVIESNESDLDCLGEISDQVRKERTEIEAFINMVTAA